MPDTQVIVEVSTLVIFAFTAILAGYLTKNYLRGRRRSTLFWSIGLWLFAIGVILETAFAFGAYDALLIDVYLFIVALLVNSLALGSMELLGNSRLKTYYYVFSAVTLTALAFSLAFTSPGDLLLNYVVAVPLPMLTTITSSFVTFPAAVILVVIAAKSFMKTRSKKMLSIIAGVVVVSIAGSLYIAAFPAFLYYSEFIGIVLLWLGFFDFGAHRRAVPEKLAHSRR